MTQPTKIAYKLTTTEEHLDLLLRVLTSAQERILIISPCLVHENTPHMVNIIKQIDAAVKRGVIVSIYTDYKFNCIGGELRPAAMDGIALLTQAGAQVYVIDGTNNKVLARDFDLIAEDGSFHWLSTIQKLKNGNIMNAVTSVHTSNEALGRIKEWYAKFDGHPAKPAFVKPTSKLKEKINTFIGRLKYVPDNYSSSSDK